MNGKQTILVLGGGVGGIKVGRHWHAGKVLFEKNWLRRWVLRGRHL